MKAIFIPENFNPTVDLEKLNRDLKDTYSITQTISVNSGNSGYGTLLIVDNHTRKDKLEKINNISNG